MPIPRLWNRGGTYYFRAKVPADLLNEFGGALEVKYSLPV
jgi:hypothetical protein